MKELTTYTVYKFFPPRCPKCLKDFHSPTDFIEFAVGKGTSFLEALKSQFELFPEMYKISLNEKLNMNSIENKFDMDFSMCRHCNNATLRVKYAERQVMTFEEANELLTTDGFTSITESKSYGNMAQPLVHLNLLARAELVLLENTLKQAREKAASASDEMQGGDIYSHEIEPLLVYFMRKLHESDTLGKVQEHLQNQFSDLWGVVGEQCRNFLMTAEVLRAELDSYSEADPTIEYSSVVAMYSKGLEIELKLKLFTSFKQSSFASQLPQSLGDKSLDRSLVTLRGFVDGSREITLGDMGFCLLNLGCKSRNMEGNGFSMFLHDRIKNFEEFCNDSQFPGKLIQYAQDYRNRAAHVSKLTRLECMSARAMLLEAPIKLLITLENTVAS